MASNASNIKAGGAYVELTAKDGKLNAGLKSAEAKLARFGAATKLLQVKLNSISLGFANTAQSINNVSNGLMSAGGKIFGVAALMGGALAYAVKQSMDLGEALDKMSGRTGASVEWLSAMRYAADMSGATIEEVENALKGLNETYAEASIGRGRGLVWLKELGVDLKELENLNTEQKFEVIADAISKVDDAAKRTKYATGIFRGGGEKLLPMIGNAEYDVVFNNDAAKNSLKELGLDANKLFELKPEVRLAEVRRALDTVDNEQKRKSLSKNLIVQKPGSIDQLKGDAKQLGLIVSTEQSKNAAALNDALGQLKMTMQMLAVSVGNALSPSIKKITENIAEISPKIKDWVEKNEGTIVSFAKLIPILAGVGLGIMGLGVALKPVAWIFSALSIGALGLSKSIGFAVGSFKMLGTVGGFILSVLSKMWIASKSLATPFASIGKMIKKLSTKKIKTDVQFFKFLKFFFGAGWFKKAPVVGAFSTIGAALKNVGSLFGRVFGLVGSAMSRAYKSIATAKPGATITIWAKFLGILKSLSVLFTATSMMMASKFGLILALIALIGFAFYKSFGEISEIVKNITNSIVGFFKDAFAKITGIFTGFFARLSENFVKLKEFATENVGLMVESFKAGNLSDAFQIGFASIKVVGLAAMLFLIKEVSNALGVIRGIWYNLIDGIKNAWTRFVTSLAIIAVELGNAIRTVCKEIFYAFEIIFRSIWDVAANYFDWITDMYAKGFLKIKGIAERAALNLKKIIAGDDEDKVIDVKIRESKEREKNAIAGLDEDRMRRKAERQKKYENRRTDIDLNLYNDRKNTTDMVDALAESELDIIAERKKRNEEKAGTLIFGVQIEGMESALDEAKKELEESSKTVRSNIAKKKSRSKSEPGDNLPKNLDGIMGSFQLKDLSFFGGDKNNDMTTHQKMQNELTKRTNRILEGIAARKQGLSFL